MAPALATHTLSHARIAVFGKPYNFKPLVRDWQHVGHFHDVIHLVAAMGGKSLAVPQVYTFNAKTISYRDFPTKLHLEGIDIRTGILADAVILQHGEAAGIVTGDCPTIVIENEKTGEVAAAHGGRDSNIDRQFIDTDIPSRPHESVVASILSYTDWRPDDLRVFICAGIAPAHFEHPWSDPHYGENNRALTKWIIQKYGEACLSGNPEDGRIDLHALIEAQCFQAGIPTEHIHHDALDTYDDEQLWSHRNKNKRDGRNMVLVSVR